jgi:hypothetical protein
MRSSTDVHEPALRSQPTDDRRSLQHIVLPDFRMSAGQVICILSWRLTNGTSRLLLCPLSSPTLWVRGCRYNIQVTCRASIIRATLPDSGISIHATTKAAHILHITLAVERSGATIRLGLRWKCHGVVKSGSPILDGGDT